VRVGIVAYELEGEATGVGRYLSGLLSGLTAVSPGPWRFPLFFHRRVPELELLGHAAFEPVLAARSPSRAIAYEQLVLPGLARRARLDLLFSPGYSLPPRSGVPGVVALHDLSFERFGAEFGWRERWRRRLLARRAARVARRVLVDTAAMRDEVGARYRLPPERVGVVPLGVDERFGSESSPGDTAELERLGVRTPYLLYVGALLERRCPDLMLEVLAALSSEDPRLQLVVAGPDRLRDRTRFRRRCDELGLSERVRSLGWVADAALPALYRGAAATLYLSRYEGFGLPPLEALAAGTPAVVGSGLGLDELWPDYPYRVEALETTAVVATCRAAMACDRRWLAAVSRDRLAPATWERAARLWIAEMERAAA
jgi:glycosyltransferase involved in cell wall biosynthesis